MANRLRVLAGHLPSRLEVANAELEDSEVVTSAECVEYVGQRSEATISSSSSSPSGFEMPASLRPLRQRVLEFMETVVYPLEAAFDPESTDGTSKPEDALGRIVEAQAEAKRRGLWALGHPKSLGGGGLPFLDYCYINEVQGRSELGQVCLGTHSLQDSLMLHQYGSEEIKAKYLQGIVNADIYPSFAMTEPDVASSDPTGLQTTAVLEGDHWVINGRKWFTTNASIAAYTTVMARTEFDPDTPIHFAFSMIVVPTDTPGYKILRNLHTLGLHGASHDEVLYENVRVPASNLLGPRGQAFVIAQQRLGPGRIFHCMRWLGQAQRAFDLMCRRLLERKVRGEPLSKKQLMQRHVFDSYSEIQAARLLTMAAARKLDMGERASVELAAAKVVGARMLHNVIDRAIQVFGAKGLTDDTPLNTMYRAARAARLYDGPDEVHIKTLAMRVLMEYNSEPDSEGGGSWDFGMR